MNELSIANVEFLKSEMLNSGLTFSHLRDDLIDHVCCDVEYEMSNGLSFCEAYEMVKQKIGIEGLIRIQHETLYLIDKNYRIMKTTMKLFGILAPLLISVGTVFKIMHWPTAGILLALGFFLLAFVFLPSAIFVSYKEVSNKTKKWFHITGFLGTFFLAISFLFKIMHWPGTSIVMLLGIILLCFIFLPSVLYYKTREKDLNIPKPVIVTAILGLLFYCLGFLFKMQHWPGAMVFFMSGGLFLVFIAFPLYVYKVYKGKKYIQDSFIFIVIALVWFVLPTTLFALNLNNNLHESLHHSSQKINNHSELILDNTEQLYAKTTKNNGIDSLKVQREAVIYAIEKLNTLLDENKGRQPVQLISNEYQLLVNEVQTFEKLLCSVAPPYKSSLIKLTKTDKNFDKNIQFEQSGDYLNSLKINLLLAENIAVKYAQQ